MDLIQRFGTVEQALDRAAEVEKKTYRESLQNNRENILLSKQLVTIDRNVPVDLDENAMKMGEPDREALRELFTELEFTSLLKDLLPVAEVGEAHYSEAKSASDVEAVLQAVPAGGALAVAVEAESRVCGRRERCDGGVRDRNAASVSRGGTVDACAQPGDFGDAGSGSDGLSGV